LGCALSCHLLIPKISGKAIISFGGLFFIYMS
jgi:hypothetical protein